MEPESPKICKRSPFITHPGVGPENKGNFTEWLIANLVVTGKNPDMVVET